MTSFQNSSISWKPGGVNFANIEIAILLVKWMKFQFLPVFPDINEIVNLSWKNVDVSRTQVLCRVIYTFLGSSLGKV